jgi:hypothetical protein
VKIYKEVFLRKVMARRNIWRHIFPPRCEILHAANGNISVTARGILLEAMLAELKEENVEHPCYGCARSESECSARRVKYHDESNKWYV